MTSSYSEKTSNVHSLPDACIHEFNKFKTWHDELKEICEKENLQGKEEIQFLENILPEKKVVHQM